MRTRLASLSSSAFLLSLVALAPACTDAPPTGGGQQPFRDKWRVVHEGDFQLLNDEGDGAYISNIQIGSSLGFSDNFVNRGDITVNFEGDDETIKIEFRRFTFAENEEGAQEDFDKLSLWAYNANTTSPKKPSDMEDDTRCGGEDDDGDPLPWLPDCAIYVYYDGQTQLARAGADIRVTLPAGYRQDISIATADNVVEDTYPNRGNICVSNLNASLDADLQSGLAFVTLANGVTPSPKCEQDNPEGLDICINNDDPETPGSDAWASSCPCIASGDLGQVKITSLAPSSADITVDATVAGLWTSFRAENTGENELGGKNCPAAVEGLGDIEFTQNDTNQPWLLVGESNHPSAAAPAGAGFSLQLQSNGCEPVAAVESTKDWDKDVTDPDADVRGKTTVCAGCLAGKSCEDLLPGG